MVTRGGPLTVWALSTWSASPPHLPGSVRLRVSGRYARQGEMGLDKLARPSSPKTPVNMALLKHHFCFSFSLFMRISTFPSYF